MSNGAPPGLHPIIHRLNRHRIASVAGAVSLGLVVGVLWWLATVEGGPYPAVEPISIRIELPERVTSEAVGDGDLSARSEGAMDEPEPAMERAAHDAATSVEPPRRVAEEVLRSESQSATMPMPRSSREPASAVIVEAERPAPTSTATAPVPPVPPVPPSTSFPVDDFLAQLLPGNMAFRRPPAMLRGETKIVSLVVSQTLSIPELKETIQAKGDVVGGHTIKIAPMMQAHLTGGAFEITLITAEVQPISRTETTEWKWEIRPKEFGKLRLHLAVNALVMVGDTERSRTLRTFEETVDVNVSWTQSALAFLAEHVEWLVQGLGALVLVPLFGWLIKRWRKRATGTTARGNHASAARVIPRRGGSNNRGRVS